MKNLTDTSPRVDATLIDMLRQTPIWRKLQLMAQLNGMTHAMVLSDLRALSPSHSGRTAASPGGSTTGSRVGRQSSFNLIHLTTMFKVDIFIAGDEPFAQQQLARRRLRITALRALGHLLPAGSDA